MKRNCELACVSWPGPVFVVFRLNHLHLLARASDVGGLWPGGLDPAVRRSGEVMKQLKTRFEALPAETQERLKSQAKARREIARRAPSRLDESLREQDGDVAQGPWGLAASNGSPFSVAAVCN